MTWETVIGLETHAELATRTKIFCSCTTRFGGEPNTHCCPICTGMPGTLPMVNRKVVEYACRAGLALNCEITRRSRFDRKNYFYPDLPKAYQVSQLYLPIARNGRVSIATAAGEKVVRIHELHMEEDAGKLVHDPWLDQTRADYNRCGVPLVEIVTEPDFRSAEEVIAYLEKLKSILEYLGISDCKMQEGSLRADINLSVRPAGSQELGVRTEMKNMNSFRAIARAIESESQRQIDLLESGERVIQQTRRWDDSKGESTAMRSKEDAQDYKYFPEPDLPPISISDEEVERVRASLPELPEQKKKRIRNIIIVAVILVAASIATYWMQPQNKALAESEVFSEEEVKAQAEKIIGLLNAEDFDSLQSLVVQDMQEIMNKERMDEGKARISEDWGDFVSIETMQDAEIIQRGAHIAAVYVTAEYENIEVHYTLAFNEDMKLASFGIQ